MGVLVVCGVEATSFEDDPGARPQQSADFAAAFGTCFERLVAHLLQFIEMYAALRAFILISWHL